MQTTEDPQISDHPGIDGSKPPQASSILFWRVVSAICGFITSFADFCVALPKRLMKATGWIIMGLIVLAIFAGHIFFFGYSAFTVISDLWTTATTGEMPIRLTSLIKGLGWFLTICSGIFGLSKLHELKEKKKISKTESIILSLICLAVAIGMIGWCMNGTGAIQL